MMESPDSSTGVQPARSKLLAVVSSDWFLAGIASAVVLGFVIHFLMNAFGPRPIREHVQCRNNLRQIGLALHNYADIWGALPPAYTVDANGKRLHSWRTLILPYLDSSPLYHLIDLTRPWDDPVNKHAWDTNQPVYQCPGLQLPAGFTNYMAVVGPDYCFLPDRARPFSEITDPLADTVMVFETSAAEAVHWMSPHDASPEFFLSFNSEAQIPHNVVLEILLADGRVRAISSETSHVTRQALLTVAGDEPVGEY
ncbi:DUF1559 family PulG-like putative transporter [Planctomicrobium sp. SH664]|uniref:DUF1559 family PulG-like putative transporter n=1 Tax=Planctomicrobium sp. SH664 TaxID=3448125 RepID=UPI003F5C5160